MKPDIEPDQRLRIAAAICHLGRVRDCYTLEIAQGTFLAGHMLRRREFLTILRGAAAVRWPLPLRAQRSAKIPSVGVLLYGTFRGIRIPRHSTVAFGVV
jgi:hypothetical protein